MSGVVDRDLVRPGDARPRPVRSLYAGNARAVMLRGWRATRSTNGLVIASGFFEPIFYLLAMGIGLAPWSATSRRRVARRCRMPRSSRPRCSRSPR